MVKVKGKSFKTQYRLAGILVNVNAMISFKFKLRLKFRKNKHSSTFVNFHRSTLKIQHNCTYPDTGYPDQLDPLGKFVENSTQLTCLEITGYRTKYSTVLWLLELQIRRGRKV